MKGSIIYGLDEHTIAIDDPNETRTIDIMVCLTSCSMKRVETTNTPTIGRMNPIVRTVYTSRIKSRRFPYSQS